MQIEFVATGSELLDGRVINTHAQWLGKELFDLGMPLSKVISVADKKTDLKDVFKQSIATSDVLIISGGLGPTEDDITKDVLADLLNRPLHFHSNIFEDIKNLFIQKNKIMTPNNKKQAFLPEGAVYIENKLGSAPAFYFIEKQCLIVCVQGVFHEMAPILKQVVFPKMKSFLIEQGNHIHVFEKKVFRCFGIGESALADIIDQTCQIPADISISYRAYFCELSLVVTCLNSENKKLFNQFCQRLTCTINQYIFSESSLPITRLIADKLTSLSQTVSVAESCTGGLLSAALVSEPGASTFFLESLVTYSNESKMTRLGVSKQLLDTYGSVSEQVSSVMCCSMLDISNYAISVTGIAGPGGSTDQKPLGLVYISIGHSDVIETHKYFFKGSRLAIQQQTVHMALLRLYLFIQNIESS